MKNLDKILLIVFIIFFPFIVIAYYISKLDNYLCGKYPKYEKVMRRLVSL